MRRYVENVPPSLTQKELHDRAYALLYRVLKDEWGIASPVVEKTPLGKPYLKGENMPHISLSHTKGIVCCAVSRKNGRHRCRISPPACGECRRARLYARRASGHTKQPQSRRALSGVLDAQREHLQVRAAGLSESFQNYEITFQNGMPHLNGYTLFFEQYGVHFLAAAEEA